MQRVDKYVIFQTVGREADWQAAASALGKESEEEAPHLIYMPEQRLTRDFFLNDAINCIKKYGWVSVVCGTGILWEDGTPVSASEKQDNFSSIEFGAMGGSSAALNLHKILLEETEYRGEFQIMESLPMCASDRTSAIDLEEAFACGKKAVEIAE